MYNNLNHLNSDELEEFMVRYYGNERVADLIDEYKLDIKPCNLYKYFPPEEFEETCLYCGEHLIRKRCSKTSINNRSEKKRIHCPFCGHRPYVRCDCQNCLKVKQQEQDHLVGQVSAHFSKIEPVDYLSLSFIEKIYLAAICWTAGVEKQAEISPFDDAFYFFTPIQSLKKAIFDVLINRKILVVSSASPIKAFDIHASDFPETYDAQLIKYRVNVKQLEEDPAFFQKLTSPIFSVDENKDEIIRIWKMINIAECVKYLEYQLDAISLELNVTRRLYEIFDSQLNYFSEYQILRSIYIARQKTSSAILSRIKKIKSPEHAVNYCICCLENYLNMAILNNWSPYGFTGHPIGLPKSTISQFFFNLTMRLGDLGYTCAPGSFFDDLSNDFFDNQ